MKFPVSPKAEAAIIGFLWTLGSAILALAAGAAAAFVTNNGLALDPTYSAVLVAVLVPLLVAFQEWATWEEHQPPAA